MDKSQPELHVPRLDLSWMKPVDVVLAFSMDREEIELINEVIDVKATGLADLYIEPPKRTTYPSEWYKLLE